MTGRQLSVALVLVVGAGLAWWFSTGSAPSETEPATTQPESGPEPAIAGEAALRGGGSDTPQPARPTRYEQLVKRAGAGTPDEKHAVWRDIKALYEAGQVPLERLVALALRTEGIGNDELRAWALAELIKQKPASNRFLTEILEAGLGVDEKRQDQIAHIIRKWGVITKAQVPITKQLFEHKATEYWLKRVLVDAMDELGPDALPLAPHLMDWVRKVLVDRSKSAKEAAEAGISVSWDHVEYDVEGVLGDMGDAVVPILVERLKRAWAQPDSDAMDDMWDPVGIYADAIASSGDLGIQTLMDLLATVDPDDRSTIIHALKWVDGPNETIRLAFVDLLKDGDAWTRRQAAEALSKHGSASIPALLAALSDSDSNVRRAATRSLQGLKVPPEQALDALMRLVNGADGRAALSAAAAVAKFEVEAVRALPKAIEWLGRSEDWERGQWAELVGALGRKDPGQLLRAFEAASARGREGLIYALDFMARPYPDEITRMLEQALQGASGVTQVRAAALLIAQGHKDALGPLIAGFDSEDPLTRTLATSGLAHGGPGAAHLLPRMLERVGRDDLFYGRVGGPGGEIRESGALDEAIQALGKFDLDRMLELIDHEDFDTYYAARNAFTAAREDGLAFLTRHWKDASDSRKRAMLDIAKSGMFDRGGKGGSYRAAALEFIRLALRDKVAAMRMQGIESLYRAPDMTPEVLPVLIGLLADSNLEIANTAGYRIQALGAAAKPVEAELRALAPKVHESVRAYIRKALAAIEDAGKETK